MQVGKDPELASRRSWLLGWQCGGRRAEAPGHLGQC